MKICLKDIKIALKNIETQRPENERVYIRIFVDGSGTIVSQEIDSDFEPTEMYEFETSEQLSNIICAYL